MVEGSAMLSGVPRDEQQTSGTNPPWTLCVGWNVAGERAVPILRGDTVSAIACGRGRSRSPVLLRDAAAGWPAVRTWTLEGIRERVGARVVPVVRVTDGLLGYDARSGMHYDFVPVSAVIDALLDGAAPRWFLTLPPAEHFPELISDLRSHAPVSRAPWSDARLSLGAAGNTTPIHREIADNLFTVIRGEKEVALFAPHDSRRLESFGPLSGAPHISPIDPRSCRLDRHRGIARCTVWRARVGSGDVLLIPRGWWHAVRTTRPTVAMGSWWADGLYALVPMAAGVYKRIFRIRT